MAKLLFVVCAHVLLVKLASSQCISALNDLASQFLSYPNSYGLDLLPPASTLSNNYYNLPCTGNDVIYANLETVSSSPIAPGVISVSADNLVIDGFVSVSGSMPLYGAVVVDGNVPTTGLASLAYSAGNGISLGGSGYGNQIITSSGQIVTNPGVVGSTLPVLNGPFGGVTSSGPYFGSTQVVTSSGPVVTSSQFQRGPVNPGVVVNSGCGCY